MKNDLMYKILGKLHHPGVIISIVLIVLIILVYSLGNIIFDQGTSIFEKIMSITDPTERGLSYVAAAILLSGIIRAMFNK